MKVDSVGNLGLTFNLVIHGDIFLTKTPSGQSLNEKYWPEFNLQLSSRLLSLLIRIFVIKVIFKNITDLDDNFQTHL